MINSISGKKCEEQARYGGVDKHLKLLLQNEFMIAFVSQYNKKKALISMGSFLYYFLYIQCLAVS